MSRTNRSAFRANLVAWSAVAALLFPLLWLLQMSLKTGPAQFEMPPRLLFVPSLQNYQDLLDTNFLRALANSTIVAAASAAIALAIGVPAAYALSRGRIRARDGILLWILSARMTPPIVFALPLFMVYRQLGWIDTFQGLVLVYLTFSLSFAIWIMRSFFDALPRSIEDAAEIDGASIVQRLVHIALPLALPGIVTTGILSFLLAWNDFFFSLLLTRSQWVTAPVAIVNFISYQGWDWGRITAASVFVTLPVVVFGILLRRHMVSGLTAGAVRG